jgi:hypothetical protein
MGKKSGPGMTIPYHFSESLDKQFLRRKILEFFYADPDPGSGIFLTLDEKMWIKDPG